MPYLETTHGNLTGEVVAVLYRWDGLNGASVICSRRFPSRSAAETWAERIASETEADRVHYCAPELIPASVTETDL